MSRYDLPEGIPLSNEKQSYAAPDVATPNFTHADDEARHHKTVHEKREVFERVVEDDESENEDRDGERDDRHTPHKSHGPNVMHVMLAIALLLLALAAMVVAKNRDPVPYCSSQPNWNQYNCLPG